jgi:hypothetical protein
MTVCLTLSDLNNQNNTNKNSERMKKKEGSTLDQKGLPFSFCFSFFILAFFLFILTSQDLPFLPSSVVVVL